MRHSRSSSLGALALASVVGLTACSGGSDMDAADLVLTGGRVVTVDAANTEGEAIAVRDGRMLAVGSAVDIEAYIGSDTEVVDLDGRMAIPGFIEGHGHFMGLGNSKTILDLMDVESFEEIV